MKKLHERKIIPFFLSFLNHTPFGYHAYLDTSVFYVSAHGEMEIMMAASELVSVD